MINKVKEPKMKKDKKSTNKAVLPIIFYVVAALIGVYAIYTMYSTGAYIKDAMDAGSVTLPDQLSDIVTYFISQSLPNVFYAMVTWAIGYGVSKLTKIEALLKADK